MDDYSVYCHTFPNGKKYIGITKMDVKKRWDNGFGYSSQPKIARAIAKFGWDNIKHEILAVGLTKELANQLEQYYIAKYDSFVNGYNSTIGGDNILTCYLDSYVLDMIHYVKNNYPFAWDDTSAKIVYDDKDDKEAADFWNEAADAVIRKHGKFSTTDDRQVAYFWFHISEYCDLYCRMQRGEDVSKWRERELPEAVLEWFFDEAVVSG